MTYQKATRQVMKGYRGHGWPTVFTFIRLFLTAPFKPIEAVVPKEGRIIDLGCGYGIFANLLAAMSEKRDVVGMDLDDYKVKYAAKKRSNVSFQVADITKTDIEPADCILLIHVLHHLNSYEEQDYMLDACIRKLKPGGCLVIAEIDSKPWWKFMLTHLADRLLYNFCKSYYRAPNEIVSLLSQHGLSVETQAVHKGTPFSHIQYIGIKPSG